MLGGIKIIPRDQIDKEEDRNSDAKGKKKSTSRKQKGSKRGNKNYSSDDETEKIDKSSKRKKKWYSSEEYQSDAEEKKRGRKKRKDKSNYSSSSEDEDQKNRREKEKSEIGRKEIGMDWMLRPANKAPEVMVENQVEEPPEEVPKANPRELNPYLKDNGTGYSEELDEKKGGSDRVISSSVVVGDGGASWRLKALKRAQEQAARDGQSIDEVVKERWGSIGDLAVSAASQRAAPLRAHLRAIKSRQLGQANENQTDSDNRNLGRDYLRDVSHRHSELRAPKVGDSLSWGKRKGHNISSESSGIISAAVSSINKFSNDGSFMDKFRQKPGEEPAGTVSVEASEDTSMVKEPLSTNQLAAKALQLRMKGKHEEAERLLQEVEKMKATTQGAVSRQQNTESTNRYVVQDVCIRKRKDEDDADVHLARKIAQNKQYGRPDDEYDYEEAGPSRKSRKKQTTGKQTRILTQQERCLFCFENPNRPKHLVVSIANFTYLMLPPRQSLVPGHCCISPMLHEASTRSLDDNVWGEIRNFKKCVIMMFAQQEKDVVFLETVIALAQQRRHCLIECIPLPREIAKHAPLYFKKAIDEAEDEWSQHNAKKLIDTSKKGLRGSIPVNFPYFHVEFGLDRGFVHVIDDEKEFGLDLGFNVIRGMLQLAEEDMYRRNRRHEAFETQKEAVNAFARDWEPFDWTKQLDSVNI